MNDRKKVGWFVIEARDTKKRKIWQVIGWHAPFSVRQVITKTKKIDGVKVKMKIVTTKEDVIKRITNASPTGWVNAFER